MDPNGTIESLGGKPLLEMLRTHLVGWHLLQRLPPLTAPAEDPTELSQQDQGFLKYSLIFLVQLNEYETAPYFFHLSQNLTLDFLYRGHWLCCAKGQMISKRFLVSSDSSKKTNEQIHF